MNPTGHRLMLQRYVTSTLTLLVLDVLWLYMFMIQRYEIMVKKIQGSHIKVRVWSAICAYALMVLGLCIFVIPRVATYQDAFVYGGLFGLVTYGIFDFTCLSVFSDFDVKLAIIDILWGSFVYFMAALVSVQ